MEYQQIGNVAVLAFDDGKANAIGHDFMDAMNEGLNRAEQEASAVVISGRAGVFSGGFDLKEISKGPEEEKAVMAKGEILFHRLFSFPQPVVAACTGHAIAAGAFLLLAADYRVGVADAINIGLNETSIAATYPVFAVQLATTRLNPVFLPRAFVQSEMFSAQLAMAAGFLDQIEPAEAVVDTAVAVAQRLGDLPAEAYAINKRDSRQAAIDAMAAAIQRFG